MESKETILKYLDCNNALNDNLDKFIELFVEYYGEDKREYITNKFKNTIIVGYQTPSAYKNLVFDLEKAISEELVDDFMNKISNKFTKKELFEWEDNIKLNYKDTLPINKFYKFFKLFSLEEEERKKTFVTDSYDYISKKIKDLKYDEYIEYINNGNIPKRYEGYSFIIKYLKDSNELISNFELNYKKNKKKFIYIFKKIDDSIDESNVEEKLKGNKELSNLINEYEKLLINFENEKTKYKEYFDKRKNIEELTTKLNKKYYERYLNNIKEYLPEKHKGAIEKYLKSTDKYKSLDIETVELVGYSMDSVPLFSFFSKENEDKLNKEKIPMWEKENIKENRIKFYKKMGIDLGNDYNYYIEN